MPLSMYDKDSDGSATDSNRVSNQRKDQISHFILRLAFCRSEELRRWFLAQESHLLKFRLERLTDQELYQFMSSNGINFEQVSNDQKMRLRDNLVNLCGVSDETFDKCRYYR
jgi:DNA primase large subunit